MMELAIKKDGVIYLKTRIPKATKHECDECDYGNKYGRKKNCDNYTLDGCKAGFHYKIKKENSMKKSELRFKCMLGSKKRNEQMYDAILNAGIENHIRKEDFVKTAMCLRIDNELSNEVSPKYYREIDESYEESTSPEVTFEAALEMLESIEPDAPDFDIKPFDRVLARGANCNEWFARLYESKGNCNFIETGGYYCNQIIKYDGNEHFHRTINTPASWWECENGKPVWKNRQN